MRKPRIESGLAPHLCAYYEGIVVLLGPSASSSRLLRAGGRRVIAGAKLLVDVGNRLVIRGQVYNFQRLPPVP